MKKITILIFIILLIAFLSIDVFASNSYNIPELNFSIEAPDGWIVITQNPEDNEEAAQLLGTDTDYLVSYLKQRAIYIDFLKEDLSEEIFVNMTEDENSKEAISINSLSEKQLEKAAESIMGISIEDIEEAAEESSFEGIDATDVEWLSYEIYNHEQAVFFKLYHNKMLDNVTIPSILYSTVQNGQSINISIMSYSGEISDTLESLGKDVVDSIVFTEIQEANTGGIDFLKVIKSGVITGLACAIFFGLFAIIKVIKDKKNNNTPPNLPPNNISSSTHSGTID